MVTYHCQLARASGSRLPVTSASNERSPHHGPIKLSDALLRNPTASGGPSSGNARRRCLLLIGNRRNRRALLGKGDSRAGAFGVMSGVSTTVVRDEGVDVTPDGFSAGSSVLLVLPQTFLGQNKAWLHVNVLDLAEVAGLRLCGSQASVIVRDETTIVSLDRQTRQDSKTRVYNVHSFLRLASKAIMMNNE